MDDAIKSQILEGEQLKKKLLQDKQLIHNLTQAILLIKDCLKNGNKLLMAGNGGSSSDANHFASEIVGRYKGERRGYPAISFTNDTSFITNWSNDYEYHSLFARQLEAHGKKGDIFVAFTTSGNSMNLVHAAKKAKELGIKSICFLGKGGGKLLEYTDIPLLIPSSNTPRIQEAQVLLMHIICEELENLIIMKDRKKYLEIINAFQDQRVLVIGDAMLDHYVWTAVERISAEAPIPVARVEQETFILGGAANTAHNVASLGAKVELLSVVGEDEAGNKLKNILKESRIQTSGVLNQDPKPTVVKMRVMSGMYQLLRVDREDINAIPKDLERKLLKYLTENIPKYSLIIVSDYDKGLMTETFVQGIIQKAIARKLKVVVDTKPQSMDRYKGSYLIKPNKREAELYVGKMFTKDYSNVAKIADEMQKRLKSKLLITLGKDGMFIYDNGTYKQIETSKKEVFDVSGAGDTTTASVGLALAAGATLEEAATLANIAAGVVVTKLGTAVCTKQELLDEVNQ